MYSKELLLSSIKDVRNFINVTSMFEEDIDIIKGRYVVDGKSIMGIFTIDLSKPIEVRIYTDNKERADIFFNKLICK